MPTQIVQPKLHEDELFLLHGRIVARREDLEALGQKIVTCLKTLLARMEKLDRKSLADFTRVKTDWFEVKKWIHLLDERTGLDQEQGVLEIIYKTPGWLNYRRIRNAWNKKRPSSKAKRKEYDSKRNQDPDRKAQEALRMKAFRASKK